MTAAPFTNMTDCVRATLRANAVKGPFQGLGATLVRNVPANSIYLGSFEVLKDRIARWQGVEKADLPGSKSPAILCAAVVSQSCLAHHGSFLQRHFFHK